METTNTNIIWIHILYLLLVLPGRITEGASCLAGNFTHGDTATVVCLFEADVRVNQLGIIVKQYLEKDKFSEMDWLHCNWKRNSSGVACSPSGIQLNGELGRNVSILINSVTSDYSGWYSCHTVPSREVHTEKCRLSVKEDTLSETTTTFAEQKVNTEHVDKQITVKIIPGNDTDGPATDLGLGQTTKEPNKDCRPREQDSSCSCYGIHTVVLTSMNLALCVCLLTVTAVQLRMFKICKCYTTGKDSNCYDDSSGVHLYSVNRNG